MCDRQAPVLLVPGRAGNTNAAGNPAVSPITVETDRRVLELRARARRLEHAIWYRRVTRR